MKVNAISLRPGNIIEYNGKISVVLKHEIIHPGKGQSVIQLDIRDLKAGNKDSVRFRTQETIEKLRLDQEKYQHLYNDGETYTFMHMENYEQIEIKADIIGEPAKFLQDGMEVMIESYESDPIRVELPMNVTMEVEESEPVVKGQTASSSYKPAIVGGGIKVMVPPHIEAGTRIVVKTEDGTYVEKAKD